MNNIEQWIKSRFPYDTNWTTGNCYFFAVILEAAFPGGRIVYDPIVGHFLYQYNNKFYDYYGEENTPKTWLPWNEYAMIDEKHYLHVMRDCVGGYWANGILEQEEEYNTGTCPDSTTAQDM